MDDFEKRQTIVPQLFEHFGAKMITCFITSAIHTLPTYTYHDLGDVIYELMQHDRAKVRVLILHTACVMKQHLPRPGDVIYKLMQHDSAKVRG